MTAVAAPRNRAGLFITWLRLRVGAGIAFAAVAICLFGREISWHGLPLLVLGLLIRLWAAGHLRKDEVLTVSGPYRYVRHPLYLGTLAGFLSLPLLLHSIWLALAVLLIFAPTYYWQIVAEEERLARTFGEAYCEYRRHVPRLLPRPWRPWPAECRQRFSLRLALSSNHWHFQLLYAVLGLLLLDFTEDVTHSLLFHHQSLAQSLTHLRDIAEILRTGRF